MSNTNPQGQPASGQRPAARPAQRPYPGPPPRPPRKRRTRPGESPELAAIRADRTRRILLTAGVVALGAIIAAAVFWYSGGGGGQATRPPDKPTPVAAALTGAPPRLPATATGAAASGVKTLVIGSPSAPTKVVVYDDFGSTASQTFEMASREFLHSAAAENKVEVEYRLVSSSSGYSSAARDAFVQVLDHGSPTAARRFHDLLFDKLAPGVASTRTSFTTWAHSVAARVTITGTPATAYDDAVAALARKAGVVSTPAVFLDGKRLGGSPVQMADAIQTAVLAQ